MALKIIWTLQAVNGLQKVLDYLEKEWSEKEILNLEVKIEKLIKKISRYPKICPPSGTHKNLRRGIIDKNNYIIYRIKPQKKSNRNYQF